MYVDKPAVYPQHLWMKLKLLLRLGLLVILDVLPHSLQEKFKDNINVTLFSVNNSLPQIYKLNQS